MFGTNPKRVVSSSEMSGEKERKISKTSGDGMDLEGSKPPRPPSLEDANFLAGYPPVPAKIVEPDLILDLADDDDGGGAKTNGGDGKEEEGGVALSSRASSGLYAPPLSSITKQVSAASSTSSSLSDRSAVSEDDDDDAVAAEATAPKSPKSDAPDAAATAPGMARTSPGGGSPGPKSSASAASSRTSHATSDNWGWFENVHASSIDMDKAAASDAAGDEHKNKSRKKKKKKGGLLHFGAALGEEEEAIVNIRPIERTSMAVTAPQYVLEESISNQKLWKHTAGNRPPQPVEERAFFENIWAQNFVRSQVSYEMPVEVLTATSPISLSPFAEGNTGDAISNYDIGARFTPNVIKRTGVDGTADAKAAEADAAEATLRMSGTAGAAQYYSQARANDPKALGPHSYHHTPVNKKVPGGDDVTVVVKGDNVFGTTVSKSFPRPGSGDTGVDTISISIASYRVVESKKKGRYAQFLVVYCDGCFRETLGVWKRFSDFDRLSNKVIYGHADCSTENCSTVLHAMDPLHEDPDVEPLPNAMTSWRLLKKRQRWFRCLDAGYLSLKVFLLERFLHDILFESSNPKLLREFVGVV